MSFTEKAVTFDCAGESLLGILALPELPRPVGVVIVVGGPQYRVGSHRQFLLLSRALADAGYPTMRFDYRGMGDSTGELRNFEGISDDIHAAIDAFQTSCPELSQFVLWGLCDAASACLLYWDATQDSRVNGLVLLNPWVRSETTLARAHIKHYYGQRLLQAEFWRKLLTGKLGLGRAISGFFGSLKSARQEGALDAKDKELPFQKKMARGIEAFPRRVLLLLSGNDYTAKEFLEAVQADQMWTSALRQSRVTRVDIAEADHTFSSAEWRGQVENITREWLEAKANQ
jgi:exosortase A-associated hydrolase 1